MVRQLSVWVLILLELLSRCNPVSCLGILDLAYLSLGVNVRLVNDFIHLLSSLLQLWLLLCKLNITTLSWMLDKIWQESWGRCRDWGHIRWVNVVHLLSMASDCLRLSLDKEVLLARGGYIRMLTLRLQCYEFIAYRLATLVVLGLFNINSS